MKLLSTILWFTALLFISFGLERNDFQPLFIAYCIAFFNYWLIYQLVEDKEILKYIWIAVLIRCIIAFAFPNLSDDIYRFIWDGKLITDGIHPFLHTPTELIQNHLVHHPIYQTLYPFLNSPDYFTVYPPVCQAIFAFSTQLFPNDIYESAIVMKIILACFDIGSVFLIRHLLKNNYLPVKKVLLYAFNPLIIIELCGNAHFESAMLFFFLLSLHFWHQQKITYTAIALAFSIASKLLPLLFIPFFIMQLYDKVNLRQVRLPSIKNIAHFIGVLSMTTLFLFLPLYDAQLLANMGKSLNLYFQKFEFNASIYYGLRWIGFKLFGYNQIAILGPALGIIVFLKILYESLCGKKRFYPNLMLSITLYLLCATIVHPWYLTLPIALSVLTQTRLALLWSFLIFGTYINYSYTPYYENLWVVGLEYAILLGFFFLLEARKMSYQNTN
jgi:hypothetical protein